MLKFIIKILKRIIISSFLLYAYNIIAQPIGINIPINIFTVGAITILGLPGLLSLIFIIIFIY